MVEMAALLVLAPILEAGLLGNEYGFRPELNVKMAARQAFTSRTAGARRWWTLSDCLSSIPHGPLKRFVNRCVADGRLPSVIRSWLMAPVIEQDRRTTRCRPRRRIGIGGPQGARSRPCWRIGESHFRRFLLAWDRFGPRKRLDAHVVNYADGCIPRTH